MGERKAYEKRQQAKLEKIEARLQQLEAQARKIRTEATIEDYRWLDELEPMHDEARQKLEEFRRAADATWAELKDGVEDATETLRRAVERASRQLKP